MTVQIDMAVRHRVGIQKLSGVVLVDSQQGGGRGKRTSHIFPQAKLKWEQRHPQAPGQNRCQLLLRTWNTSRHFLTIESSGTIVLKVVHVEARLHYSGHTSRRSLIEQCSHTFYLCINTKFSYRVRPV